MNSTKAPVRERLRHNVATPRRREAPSLPKLEVAKLIVSALTPLAVVVVGFYLSAAAAERDALAREARAAHEREAAQVAALGQLAVAISLNEARAAQFLAAIGFAIEQPPADRQDLLALRDRYYAASEQIGIAVSNFSVVAVQQGNPEMFDEAWKHFLFTQERPLAACVYGTFFFVMTAQDPRDKNHEERLVTSGRLLADGRRPTCQSTLLRVLRATSVDRGTMSRQELMTQVKAACPSLEDSPDFRKYFGDLQIP